MLDTLDPEVEGEDEQEDGDGLVVVAAGHGTRDVARSDAHEDCGKQAGRRRVGHLRRQEIAGKGRQAGAGGGEQDANVADVDGEGEEAEDVVDEATGDHEAGV